MSSVVAKSTSEFEEKVIQISRVSKKTKGGNKAGFSVLMVVGDKKGNVGIGLGKAPDVLAAIKKGVKKAKKKLLYVPIDGTTIPFSVEVKKGAGRVLLKPAPRGSGVIAGGSVRAVVEASGIRDISSKVLGSSNQASTVYATFAALKQIAKLVFVKNISLKSIADVELEESKKQEEIQKKAQEKAPELTSTKKPENKIEVAKKVAKVVAKPVSKAPAKKPAAPKATEAKKKIAKKSEK